MTINGDGIMTQEAVNAKVTELIAWMDAQNLNDSAKLLILQSAAAQQLAYVTAKATLLQFGKLLIGGVG